MFEDVPIEVNIEINLEPVKSTTKKERARLLESKYHTKKSDLDNYIKAILDALNGVAYDDDSHIATIAAKKEWAEEDLIKIKIKELKSK